MKKILALMLIAMSFNVAAFQCDDHTVGQIINPVKDGIQRWERAMMDVNQLKLDYEKAGNKFNLDIQDLITRSNSITTQQQLDALLAEEQRLKSNHCQYSVFASAKMMSQYIANINMITTNLKGAWDSSERDMMALINDCNDQKKYDLANEVDSKKRYASSILMGSGYWPTMAQVLGIKSNTEALKNMEAYLNKDADVCRELFPELK